MKRRPRRILLRGGSVPGPRHKFLQVVSRPLPRGPSHIRRNQNVKAKDQTNENANQIKDQNRGPPP